MLRLSLHTNINLQSSGVDITQLEPIHFTLPVPFVDPSRSVINSSYL